MKNLDLMKLTAEALHERAAYIVDNCESIFVRYERWPGHVENARLAVVAQRNPAKAFSEARARPEAR